MGLELYNSVSKRVSKRAGTLFMKLNGQSQLRGKNADLGEESVSFADFNISDWAQYCAIIYVHRTRQVAESKYEEGSRKNSI